MDNHFLGLLLLRNVAWSILIAFAAMFLFLPRWSWSVPLMAGIVFLSLLVLEAITARMLHAFPGLSRLFSKQLEVAAEGDKDSSSHELFGAKVGDPSVGWRLQPWLVPTLNDLAEKMVLFEQRTAAMRKHGELQDSAQRGSSESPRSASMDSFLPVKLSVIERGLNQDEQATIKMHSDRFLQQQQSAPQTTRRSPPVPVNSVCFEKPWVVLCQPCENNQHPAFWFPTVFAAGTEEEAGKLALEAARREPDFRFSIQRAFSAPFLVKPESRGGKP